MKSEALLEVLLLLETLITLSVEVKAESRNDKSTEEIIRGHDRPTSDKPQIPSGFGFISGGNLSALSSVWGCDKYSAAAYVVTKKAIKFAEEVTNYLQYPPVSDLPERSGKNYTEISLRKQKLNVLREGINFYRDFSLLLKALWHDTKNSFSLLGEQIYLEMETQISRLPFSKL